MVLGSTGSVEMEGKPTRSPLRILVPLGLGTCLSLIGDAALYAVLPTHTDSAGVPVATVGLLLSANRFVRVVANGPVGVGYGRCRRRRLYVLALFIGALSTGIYALSRGFWPLLVGRLLWGSAWAGIWIGGNAIVAEIGRQRARGRWVGLYHGFFFLGASSGALVGGVLTDAIGYHRTMGAAAGLTLIGAFIALIGLPEVERTDLAVPERTPGLLQSVLHLGPATAGAFALYVVNRLVVAGVLNSTLGLLLQRQIGAQIEVGGRSLGVATLTGSGLGLSTLIAMASASVLGAFSDRTANRWNVVAGGLSAGAVGFVLLTVGTPWSILAGVPLTALASGSNQSLSITLIGDLSTAAERSKRFGVLFTIGDLASAVGPMLAYALIPWLGVRGNYLLSAGVLVSMMFVALWLPGRVSKA
jgi:MFS family permease